MVVKKAPSLDRPVLSTTCPDSRCVAKFSEGQRSWTPVGERCEEHHQPVEPINLRNLCVDRRAAERQRSKCRASIGRTDQD
jgi:hypothetical protein